MSNDRITRVNELLLRGIGNVFTSVVSPAMPNCLATVTGVKTAIDLRDATVFVSVYGNIDKKSVIEFLERKRALIQSELARKIVLKYTPRLHFKLDETSEKADRVMAILNELDLDSEKAEEQNN